MAWEEIKLEALEIAHRVFNIASDKQAADIILLDSQEVCSFADYFVICSAESARQMKAVAEEVVHALKADSVQPLHREGTVESGWLLVDYGNVILHLFAPAERAMYDLEDLWSHARPVLRTS